MYREAINPIPGCRIMDNPSADFNSNFWLSCLTVDPGCPVTPEKIHSIVQKEIGKVFAKVLECAGVYKRTPEGQEAFGRFLSVIEKA